MVYVLYLQIFKNGELLLKSHNNLTILKEQGVKEKAILGIKYRTIIATEVVSIYQKAKEKQV